MNHIIMKESTVQSIEICDVVREHIKHKGLSSMVFTPDIKLSDGTIESLYEDTTAVLVLRREWDKLCWVYYDGTSSEISPEARAAIYAALNIIP